MALASRTATDRPTPNCLMVGSPLRMKLPDHQLDADDEAEPDRDDDERAVGAETTEPVQDAGHADNLSPRPGPEDTRSPGSRTGETSLPGGVNMAGTQLPSPCGRTAMRLGLHYWNYSTPSDPTRMADTLAKTARVAEQAGFSTFTVMDHYFQMEHAGSAAEPMLEAYTTLGYVAGLTERMTLGVLVPGVMYRHPGLLAKIVTTLDVL